MSQQIAVDDLLPHPQNSNRMNEETLEKLRRHIERCGRYEPLTVRSHPQQQGKFEIINGHHRLRVLESLGHGTADCNVWEVGDEQSLLYLATLNRLCGEDVPERRSALLEELLEVHRLPELVDLLLETEADLSAISEYDGRASMPSEEDAAVGVEVEFPQMLSFMLSDRQAHDLNTAIDKMIEESSGESSRGEALVAIARLYVGDRP